MRGAIVVLAMALAGCDSGDAPAPLNDAGPSCPPICTRDATAAKCSDLSKVATCPAHPCMAAVPQSGTVSNLRISRQLALAPLSLVNIARSAINPNVNPRCFNEGRDSFNWLIQIDKKAGTIKMGGARPAADGKTYKFLDEDVDGSTLGIVCPGFVGASVSLRPKTVKFTLADEKYRSEVVDKLNMPIYLEAIPIVLPLTEVRFSEVLLSFDGSCVGTWERDYWCDEVSLGWTTAGQIEGKILVSDADKVPVKSLGCQSLCSLLVNDATKTDPTTNTCKKNADGSYPELGDTCIGGTGCKNAWTLRTGFAAYGVTIQ